METIKTQVLIIGSGTSGLYAASKLKKFNIDVLVVSASNLRENSSYYAQGGIAAALLEGDSPYLHFKDTLRAGHNLCDTWNTQILVSEGPKRVVELFNLNVPFEGVTQEGAHSRRRIWHVKDETGKAVWESLYRHAKALNVNFLENTHFVDFIFDSSQNLVCGAIFIREGKFIKVQSKLILLANGGWASLYPFSSNPPSNNGYVTISAYLLGCELLDPEFIQFHPTGFYNEAEGKSEFLISESVRGEGAHLVDEKGNRFIDELAPRDIVTRAIFKKYKEGHKVFLDFRPLKEKNIDIKKRFPYICERLKKFNLDPEKDLIPVYPLAHYTMGGIFTDSFGQTKIKNLFACGEAACTGVHGANRLASNSLLECLVFANRASHKIKFLFETEFKKLNFDSLVSKAKINNDLNNFKIENIKNISEVLWKYAGIERTEEGLKKAYRILNDIENKEENIYIKRLSKLGKIICKAALERRESRGAHYRLDYPNPNKKYEKHTLVKPNGKISYIEKNLKDRAFV